MPIIRKTHDLIKRYVPILNRMPRGQKCALGDRVIAGPYDLLEGLILARFAEKKLARLQTLNGRLDVLRHQTRLLLRPYQRSALSARRGLAERHRHGPRRVIK